MEKASQLMAGIGCGLAGLIFGTVITMGLREEAGASPPMFWPILFIGMSFTLTCVGVGFGTDFMKPIVKALIHRFPNRRHATQPIQQEVDTHVVSVPSTQPQPHLE